MGILVYGSLSFLFLLLLFHLSFQTHGSASGSLLGQQNFEHQDEHSYVTVTYLDASGRLQNHKVDLKTLSSSWVWESIVNGSRRPVTIAKNQESLSELTKNDTRETIQPSTYNNQQSIIIHPIKLIRQQLRQVRKQKRIAELVDMSKESEMLMQRAAIERTNEFSNIKRSWYSIWRKAYYNPLSDSTVKLIKDQIIMAKAYAIAADSTGEHDLHLSLMRQIKESRHAIGDASLDSELQESALEQAKAMGHVLSLAKDKLPDSELISRELRAMLQSLEENISTVKKHNTFLVQHAAKTLPKHMGCLSLQLTNEYFLNNHSSKEISDKKKLEDPSLYHYAIFSDNVLATSVVVNSTVTNAKEPQKHVFHIVTDKLNFAAMKMWFIAHPTVATVQVENIDDFKWLNSSYCSVLRQLESSRIQEYYFKANHPSSISAGIENLKYRNPKYLSMLNHLRFYMPEVYPKLDKILFLDDDIVVQKDLSPLWTIDMKGMVNGAVETCKASFHRFETYLNFSNPLISKNFDPQACGWAFGMNILDLKEWKKRNITGIYHYWQDSNEDRTLWKLGTLPPGLITFYNLTYPLDRSWHVLGLGYDPAINPTDIDNAAVAHYNGNYKPWLDLAFTKYKSYWSKYVNVDDPYIRKCY